MDEFIRTEFLVTRTEAQVSEQLDDYCIYEVDGTIQGCAALHKRNEDYGEIAAVAVNPNTQSSGIGQNIVEHLVERATKLGYKKVYILTTQAVDWFEKMGFNVEGYEALPKEGKSYYNQDRNSIVMMRTIG